MKSITELERQIGPFALLALLEEMANGGNNWRLAREYQLSLVEIGFLRRNTDLCLRWVFALDNIILQTRQDDDHEMAA